MVSEIIRNEEKNNFIHLSKDKFDKIYNIDSFETLITFLCDKMAEKMRELF